MGLGMLVDNGIVVVENVYRLMDEEGLSQLKLQKKELEKLLTYNYFNSYYSSCLYPTRLLPGIMGQFMVYFPITLSVVLGSSLFVAIFFNSVLSVLWIQRTKTCQNIVIISSVLVVLGALTFIVGGDYKIFKYNGIHCYFTWAYRLFLRGWANSFQFKVLPILENFYEKVLAGALKRWRPIVIITVTFILLIVSFISFGGSVSSQRTKIEFFPDNEPKQIIVYIEYPQGTDISKTNAITKAIENRVYKILDSPEYMDGNRNFLVESVVAQVGEGAGNPQTEVGSLKCLIKGKSQHLCVNSKIEKGLRVMIYWKSSGRT